MLPEVMRLKYHVPASGKEHSESIPVGTPLTRSCVVENLVVDVQRAIKPAVV